MTTFVNKRIGRFGNSLFQLFFAEHLSMQIPNLEILSFGIPEFGIAESDSYSEYLGQTPGLTLKGHTITPAQMDVMRSGRVSIVHSEVIGMQMKYLGSTPPDVSKVIDELIGLGDDREAQLEGKVLCHIRGGDIWRGSTWRNRIHPDYSSLPYAFYREIQEKESADLVFLIEPGTPRWYLEGLTTRFGSESLLPSSSVRNDFALLLKAPNLAISISSFSWMAGFLGKANKIHYPVHGLLDPDVRHDLDLKPNGNSRYIYYKPERHVWHGGVQDYRWLNHSEVHALD